MEFKKFCPTIRMLAHATSWDIDDILVDRCCVYDDIKAIGILAPSCEWEKIHALAKEMERWEETIDEEY